MPSNVSLTLLALLLAAAVAAVLQAKGTELVIRHASLLAVCDPLRVIERHHGPDFMWSRELKHRCMGAYLNGFQVF